MRMSKFTLIFSIYTILSSFFMVQVWERWESIFGINTLGLFLSPMCLATALAILYKNIKSEFNIKRIGLICAICIWGFIFAWRQPYFSEKAHVLEFAVLGWLATRDLTKQSKHLLKDALIAFVFVTIIGVLEEIYQKFLPWRVCDVRDMITDSLGGMLGVILFLLSRPKIKTLST